MDSTTGAVAICPEQDSNFRNLSNCVQGGLMAATVLLFDLGDLRRKWGWFLALGIIMIVFGMIALAIMPAATIGTVLILGWLMIFSGIVGVLIGLLVVTHPVAGALAWTLLFASFFTVIGLFRLIAATRLKFPNWGWAAFDGAVTLLLGILLWADWPWSGFWFLGLSIGISLLLRGWSHVMLGLALRSLSAAPSALRDFTVP